MGEDAKGWETVGKGANGSPPLLLCSVSLLPARSSSSRCGFGSIRREFWSDLALRREGERRARLVLVDLALESLLFHALDAFSVLH